MYQVKLNRERFRNHIQYDWWKYIVFSIITVVMWNMVTTMTRPRTPADKKIEIFLVGDFVFNELTDSISEKIKEDFPNLLEVNINNIPLGGESQMEYMGRQKLSVMLGSQTGDIFAFEKDEFEQVTKQGAFLPLDDFLKKNENLINHRQLKVLEPVLLDEESEAKSYGITMDGIELFKNTGYDVSNKVIGIMAYSKNQENAFKVLQWILNEGVKVYD